MQSILWRNQEAQMLNFKYEMRGWGRGEDAEVGALVVIHKECLKKQVYHKVASGSKSRRGNMMFETETKNNGKQARAGRAVD